MEKQTINNITEEKLGDILDIIDEVEDIIDTEDNYLLYLYIKDVKTKVYNLWHHLYTKRNLGDFI